MNIKKATKPRNYAFFQSREEVETLVVSLERKSAKKSVSLKLLALLGFLTGCGLLGFVFQRLSLGKWDKLVILQFYTLI